MGLFSKKTVKCTKCGKEFECRIAFLNSLCQDCLDEEARIAEEKAKIAEAQRAFDKSIKGYIDYIGKDIENMDKKEIAAHRDSILEKYRFPSISENYLTTLEILTLDLETAAQNGINLLTAFEGKSVNGLGASYTLNFTTLLSYPGVVIENSDVYAIAYKRVIGAGEGNTDVYLCGIFTNDPYIPVFPVAVPVKKKLFSFNKNQVLDGLSDMFAPFYKNLEYPIQKVGDFKKFVKQNGQLKSNLTKEKMLEYLDDLNYESGMFKSKNWGMFVTTYDEMKRLGEYGYQTVIDN